MLPRRPLSHRGHLNRRGRKALKMAFLRTVGMERQRLGFPPLKESLPSLVLGPTLGADRVLIGGRVPACFLSSISLNRS